MGREGETKVLEDCMQRKGVRKRDKICSNKAVRKM